MMPFIVTDKLDVPVAASEENLVRPNMSLKPKEKQEGSELSEKISLYNEVGPFLTHLPQFAVAADYFIQGTQAKLRQFG